MVSLGIVRIGCDSLPESGLCFGQTLELEHHSTEIRVCFRIVGLNGRCEPKREFGLAEPVEPQQYSAQAVQGSGIVRLQPQRLPVSHLCLRKASLLLEHVAEVVVSFDKIGTCRYSKPVCGLGIVEPAKLVKREGQIEVGLRIAGANCNCLPVRRLRLKQIAEIM